MPRRSFTKGHKCIHSEAPTHTFTYTCTFSLLKSGTCSHRYSHTNTLTSSTKLEISTQRRNYTHTHFHSCLFMFHLHKYTHLWTSSPQWTWYTFTYSYKHANPHAYGCKFKGTPEHTFTAVLRDWNTSTLWDYKATYLLSQMHKLTYMLICSLTLSCLQIPHANTYWQMYSHIYTY